MTAEPLRVVSDVLARFDTTFSDFAAAFYNGEYVLWLGSGISREKVPDVSELLERVIELLRSNRDTEDGACAHRTALDEVIQLAGLTDDELGSIDYAVKVTDWPLRNRIISVLGSQYSKVLDVFVGDENADDYLVWNGLDVPKTYGASGLQPDVEHYCIAILMYEGIVSSAVTANWDGLLEKALEDLTPVFDATVRVVVAPDDFRQLGRRIDVIKFHGCAVRAKADETVYRPLLIARESQIAAWTEQPQNQSMRKHLEVLYTDHPTLMIGLSAQDANLQTVFARAIQDLARPWPATTPAVVLSEEQLKSHHQNLLKLTYGPDHHGHATAIAKSALLGSYGEPTLLALVLSSLTQKLAFLLYYVLEPEWESDEIQRFREDLLGLRDEVANLADVDRWAFLTRLIDTINLTLKIFRTGYASAGSRNRYEPLSDRPVTQAILSPDFPGQAFGWLGIALALVGRGQTSGHWTVSPGDIRTPWDGVLRLMTAQQDAKVFFVKDSATLATLEVKTSIDDGDSDVFIIVADEEPPRSARSPRSRFGRDGKVRAGHFSIATNLANTTSADELYEAFKLAGGF